MSKDMERCKERQPLGIKAHCETPQRKGWIDQWQAYIWNMYWDTAKKECLSVFSAFIRVPKKKLTKHE